jgi:hypothetical protein
MSAEIKAKGEAMLKANAKRELDARKAKAAKMTRFVAR